MDVTLKPFSILHFGKMNIICSCLQYVICHTEKIYRVEYWMQYKLCRVAKVEIVLFTRRAYESDVICYYIHQRWINAHLRQSIYILAMQSSHSDKTNHFRECSIISPFFIHKFSIVHFLFYNALQFESYSEKFVATNVQLSWLFQASQKTH